MRFSITFFGTTSLKKSSEHHNKILPLTHYTFYTSQQYHRIPKPGSENTDICLESAKDSSGRVRD